MDAPDSPAERRARAFAELCELGETARREGLARLAAEDAALAADVERMLALDDASRGPIEALRGEVAEAARRRLLTEDSVEPAPPERLGVWKLGEKLGSGGMGEVWAAERVEGGFTQSAAIKLVRSGMASREVVQRFAVERQVLARLDHPAIASLLDGGVAPDGRPWFAMDRVDGAPITRYAEEHALALDARLGLFLAVVDAVDFAHRSLVVHRDLKPSNILVTPAGLPKLLDFGLAKLLEPLPVDDLEAHATRTDFRALTPAYAAPEQILGAPITTATDVYSLGVVLYELLTGELPHRRRASSASTLAADVEVESVERPSQRLRRLAATRPEPELARRRRRLEGDLDTIVLKALAREPARRYASVGALAADLVAHREGRPIAARPDTLGYRAAKFVHRHRVGVAAAALAALSLVGGLAVSLRETARANAAAAEARAEAKRAERVKGFLVSVFEQADPTHTQGAEMPARRILAEGASRLESELADEPEVRAELFDTVARIEASLGLFDSALASAERAERERARLFGERSREHASSLSTLGATLLALGRQEEGKQRFERAVAIFTGLGDTASPEFARALSGQAQANLMGSDTAAARADEERAAGIFADALGPDDPETLEHRSNLGVLETEVGNSREGARILEDVLARFERLDGSDTTRVLSVVLSLATALDGAGDSERALSLFERAVAGRRKIYGPGHPDVAEALVIASLRLSRAGRSEEALADLSEARAVYAAIDHPELASVDNYTGLVLADLGRFAEAEQAYARAVARFARDGEPDPMIAAVALGNQAAAIAEQGRSAEAVEVFERAVAKLRSGGEFDNPRLLRMRINWGAALRGSRHFAEARAVLEAALALAVEKLGAEHPRVAESHLELARLDLAEGGAGAADRARAHLATAEALLPSPRPSPSFLRGLAAAKAELAAHGG